MMKKVVFFVSTLVFLAVSAAGQDFNAISDAFKKSYSCEVDSNYKEAAAELIKVYDANSYEINIRLGWLNYESGSYIESMEYYQKAIDLKPYAVEPRIGFVMPAAAAGNYNQVEEQYTKILSVDPMNVKANYWLGVIYYNREQYDIAIKYFEKVTNLYPFDYDCTIMFAWTNYKMGNLREAKVLFQKVLIIRPGDSSALEGMGLIQ
jgi:tetratricopeptide (TPR) repeat protein